MFSVKTSQLERMSSKLRAVQGQSDHHVRMWVVDDNGQRLHPPYFFSKGKKDIPEFAIEKIRKSLLLEKQEFKLLVECHMTRDTYITIRLGRERQSVVAF